MIQKRKAVNMVKLAIFLLEEMPSLSRDFDSLVYCAKNDLKISLIEAQTIRENEAILNNLVKKIEIIGGEYTQGP